MFNLTIRIAVSSGFQPAPRVKHCERTGKMNVIATPGGRIIPPILIVHSAAEVGALARLRHHHRRRWLVRLRIPGLAPDQAAPWEQQLNVLLRDCGCSLGAKCVLIGLAGSIVAQATGSGWGPAQWPWFLARTVLAMVGGGVLGKALGLGLARAGIVRIAGKIRSFETLSSYKGSVHVSV
jgi:hypothetical protein